jgi:hypothetical protein
LGVKQQFGDNPVCFAAVENPEAPAILPGERCRVFASAAARQRRRLTRTEVII